MLMAMENVRWYAKGAYYAKEFAALTIQIPPIKESSHMLRLKDKYALITGGTGGIGLETARQFLIQGATVAITGRSPQALQQAGEELGQSVLLIHSDAAEIAKIGR